MRNQPKIRAQESSGNIFAELGLPNPEQELIKAQLTLQIYKITDAGTGRRNPRHQAAPRLRVDAQPRGQFLRRPLDRVSHFPRAGRPDHGEADAQEQGAMSVVVR
jgi:hypothetical protein